MLLAIDAGNTNVVFALLDGREVKGRWRIATDPRRTAAGARRPSGQVVRRRGRHHGKAPMVER